jgi:hypothetical protein
MYPHKVGARREPVYDKLRHIEGRLGMHKINELFKEVVDELWNIKRYDSEIEFKELVDFWKEYQFHMNLVNDAINAQIIAYDGSEMPFSEEDISYMIAAFTRFNKHNYNRLLVETLFKLDNAQAYQYLNKILDTDEKRTDFKAEFDRDHCTQFENTKEELRKLGNKL